MSAFPWYLYAVTAALGIVWAASEIVSVFHVTPLRALRTWGALFLMLVNALFACLALAAILQVAPNSANLFTAILVGLGWQALVRSKINLYKPLPGEPGSEGLSLPVDEIYGRLQTFARRSIDQSLARERIRLLEQAQALPVETLMREVRLLSYGLTEMDPATVDEWLARMQERPMTDEERKMLLASKLMDAGGAVMLKQLVAKYRAAPEPVTAEVPEPEGGLAVTAPSPIHPDGE